MPVAKIWKVDKRCKETTNDKIFRGDNGLLVKGLSRDFSLCDGRQQ